MLLHNNLKCFILLCLLLTGIFTAKGQPAITTITKPQFTRNSIGSVGVNLDKTATGALDFYLKITLPAGMTYEAGTVTYTGAASQAAISNQETDITNLSIPVFHFNLAGNHGNNNIAFSVKTTCAYDTTTQIKYELYNNTYPAGSPVTTFNATPTPRVLSANVTPFVPQTSVVIGETATLTASSVISPAANAVYNWYADIALTTQVATGVSFTTPPLNSNTTYYVTAATTGSGYCTGSAFPVTVTVAARHATADDIKATTTITVCPSVPPAPLTVSSTTVSSPIFKWYTDPALTPASYLATGASYTAPAITKSYYVTVQGTNVAENVPGTAKK